MPLTMPSVLEYVDALVIKLKDILHSVGIEASIDVWPDLVEPPIKCFNWMRAQYHAACVLKYLETYFGVTSIVGRSYIMGIGCLDAYEYGLNFVFGEAMRESRVAAVFTKRLKPDYYGEPLNYMLYFERLVKEVVHELGHLLGLEHCTENCVMRFSNSVGEVDGKNMYFCEKCRVKLSDYISRTK